MVGGASDLVSTPLAISAIVLGTVTCGVGLVLRSDEDR
jgi:hypothetical protein